MNDRTSSQQITTCTYIRTCMVHRKRFNAPLSNMILMTRVAYHWSYCYVSTLRVFVGHKTALLYTILVQTLTHNRTKLVTDEAGNLVFKTPHCNIPQISIAHLCQPNAASANHTASWDDRQTLSSSQHDLVLVKKSLFAAVYFSFEFKYHMHTNFCGRYIYFVNAQWVKIFVISQAIDGHSHLLSQECCYHCPAGSRQLQRGPSLQLSERESHHTAHEEERCTLTTHVHYSGANKNL